jgi:hypothetical protein
MTAIFYFAAWTDSGCLCGCWHEHQTVGEAAACIPDAGSYVIAVEDGVMRALTADEEAQFQGAIHAPGAVKPALDALRSAEELYRNDGSRYAVMMRIKALDHYKWTTRMTYGTYGQATAHAGIADRIVVFGSPVWVELRRYTEPVLTDEEPKEFKSSAGAANSPTRRAGERLVEYVSRFLEGFGISQPTLPKEDDEHSHVSREPIRVQDSDFVEFALNWLNEWDTKELERMHALQVPARLEALRNRAQRALKSAKTI